MTLHAAEATSHAATAAMRLRTVGVRSIAGRIAKHDVSRLCARSAGLAAPAAAAAPAAPAPAADGGGVRDAGEAPCCRLALCHRPGVHPGARPACCAPCPGWPGRPALALFDSAGVLLHYSCL